MQEITKTYILPRKEIEEYHSFIKRYEPYSGIEIAILIYLQNNKIIYGSCHEEDLDKIKIFKNTIHVKVYC